MSATFLTDTDFLQLDLRRTLTPWHHIGTTSGWGVVQPLMPTVCGVGPVFSPPIAARDFALRLTFLLDGHRVVDDGNYGKGDCGLLYAGGTWYPDRITRHGTYHHRAEARLRSLAVCSELVPLFGRVGFLLIVTVRNRAPGRVRFEVRPDVQAGHPGWVELAQWDYGIPQPRTEAAVAESADARSWANAQAGCELLHEGLSAEIGGGQAHTFVLAGVFGAPGQRCRRPPSLMAWRDETRQAWARRLQGVRARLPMLTSDIPGLQAYYERSLASALVCLWERPDFATHPFVATSGMDGGAICCYPWDTGGYASHAMALLLGDGVHDLIRVMTSNRLMEHHSRFAPDGTPANVPYAYNMAALVNLVHAAACQDGVSPAVFAAVRDTVLALESRLVTRGALADWGRQHNLLEMRQTGWEHFVASPNAERAECLDRLAEMGRTLGERGTAAWRARARTIRAAIRRELWDRDAGWFRCLFPDGHAERVYSIQAFDAVRAGACTPAMAARVFSHVRDGAFLGEYGVSSVSAEDEEHYELNDPDWSGGGAYSGDGPALALTLWEAGRDELAWDVLRRHFWIGRHLLYAPQEHYCDRPAVAAHKRANIVSGLMGVEAVLGGLFGVRFHADGAVSWRPAPRPEGTAQLSGLVVGGHRLDLEIDGRRAVARVDGRVVRGEAARAGKLLGPRG